MLLSIVVLSYNRPGQIKRILDNFLGTPRGDFELVLKDDGSPRFQEIEDLVYQYQDKLQVALRLHKNETNLGYDRNLIDAFSIVGSEYVFLLSDDDYVVGDKIADLLQMLGKREFDVYFTPYTRDDAVNRLPPKEGRFENFAHLIYNSILFSGLIFRRDRVLNLDKDVEFLANCIYSQVYLSSLIIFETDSYGFSPSGVLMLGGDGENFFGKNEAATERTLLENREHVAADLNYQAFLLRVIRKIALRTSIKIENDFIGEYKRRLISYGLRARSVSLSTYLSFFRSYCKSEIPFYPLPAFFFLTFFFMPKSVAKFINTQGRRSLRRSG